VGYRQYHGRQRLCRTGVHRCKLLVRKLSVEKKRLGCFFGKTLEWVSKEEARREAWKATGGAQSAASLEKRRVRWRCRLAYKKQCGTKYDDADAFGLCV
jgi:hypothetical protein